MTADIGKRVKALREAKDPRPRQEDVVAAARTCGLDWKRATVAMLERGSYELKADELLLLPRILHLAGIADLSLTELLTGGEDELHVTETSVITGAELGKLFGRRPASKVRWSHQERQSSDDLTPSSADGGTALIRSVIEAVGMGAVMTTGQRLNAYMRGVAGEAEAKAARKFGVDIDELVNAAIDLWGCSLSDKRDSEVDRAIEEGDLDVTPRTIQAFRAHKTRELLKKLAIKLAGEEED